MVISPYEKDIDNGYGVESTSSELYVRIDNFGFVAQTTLYGIHFVTEDEIEQDICMDDMTVFKLIEEHLGYPDSTEKTMAEMWLDGYKLGYDLGKIKVD